MVAQIRPADFRTWLQQAPAGSQPVLLDVREAHELEIVSVKPDGFRMQCIPMSELAQRLGELSPQQPVACLCHHGGRSQQVASFLAGNGFASVANVAGGIDAWSLQVDPSLPRY